jgi:sugar O-acyltransferase (sialic acid O-acetyltransferase NeuD family)
VFYKANLFHKAMMLILRGHDEVKPLYILGAGGLAREIYGYLSMNSFEYKGMYFAGFLSDTTDDLIGFDFKHEIIGPIKSTNLEASAVLLMGVSNPVFKEELFNFYSAKNIPFTTYIHPTSILGLNTIIGLGCVLCPYSVLTTDITIGMFVNVNLHSTLGHDVIVDDFSTISSHCDLTGGVKIGKRVSIGSNASVLPKVTVGSDSVVGAGSIVFKEVFSGSTVFGNPARLIKKGIK